MLVTAQVRRQLDGLSKLPDWSAKEEENAFELPSFSAYPLQYITSIGEYLLTLPQQLEPLAVAAAEVARGATPAAMDELAGLASEDVGGRFVSEWMSKVAEGATVLYMEQLRAIPILSDRGAQQLAADIEYLCSVLSVLYVPNTPALATFQACLVSTREQLPQLIVDEAANSGFDITTAKLVAKMQNVSLDKK